jgi:hypothetical protein
MKNSVSSTIEIKASSQTIFEVLIDPRKHPEIDGSNSVVDFIKAPEKLKLGSKFSMHVRMGVKYPIVNEVIQFEENKVIAWQHFAKHIWKYELTDNGDETTTVTETWDWSRCPYVERKGLELAGFPKRNLENIKKTLENLKKLLEDL